MLGEARSFVEDELAELCDVPPVKIRTLDPRRTFL
jgi:hypothetical protein